MRTPGDQVVHIYQVKSIHSPEILGPLRLPDTSTPTRNPDLCSGKQILFIVDSLQAGTNDLLGG
jgi:hypothetical protein